MRAERRYLVSKNYTNYKHKMLMIKKDFYTSPEVDVFTVQTEGVICQSTTETDGIGIADWTDGLDLII